MAASATAGGGKPTDAAAAVDATSLNPPQSGGSAAKAIDLPGEDFAIVPVLELEKS
jgi:hypothetical protein